jgi:hypothetical protein
LIVVIVCATVGLGGQDVALQHERGQNVTPVFEGWFKNADGTYTLSFGYLNRNFKEELDIPIGPNNRFDPGPADQGQPTHFTPRRRWGAFGVKVPADFGQKKLVWTLTAYGDTASVPGYLNPIYEIQALKESTAGNTPPSIRFARDGSVGRGPLGVSARIQAATLRTRLEVWVEDDGVMSLQQAGRGSRLMITWSTYRGPGRVTFENPRPSIVADNAETFATFDASGDYVLLVVANDSSGDGGGGSQCCWTNGFLHVNVE